MTWARLVHFYYLATPVFALLDLTVGVSLRASGIASASWRAAYYGFAFACWVVMRRWPRSTPFLGLGESSVNLFLLILSVMGPIFAAPAIIGEGGNPTLSFGVGRLFNLLLAGGILILSFHGHRAELERRATGES